IGFRLGPTAHGDTLTGNAACLNNRDIETFGFNQYSDNECDSIYDGWGIGDARCSFRCAPTTTIAFVDGDGDGVASAFTLSASDIDGVSRTVYSIDEGPDITYTGGAVAIPTGYHTYSSPFGDISSIFHTISWFSIDGLGVVEPKNSGGIEGDFCPQGAGSWELQGCPCGVDVEVTSSSTSEPKPQPVRGALVEVFDWTDPTSCAARNRPDDSELECDVANSCPTDYFGR